MYRLIVSFVSISPADFNSLHGIGLQD